MEPAEIQILGVFATLVLFGVVELVRGGFFPREASTQDNRLDIAIMFMFPLVYGGVGIVAVVLCEWLIPEYRGRSRTGLGGPW